MAEPVVIEPGQPIPLGAHKRGDTWPGFSISLTADPALDITGATIRMGFKKDSPTGKLSEQVLTSDGGEIEIFDGTHLTIKPVTLELGVGTWHWDIQFDLAQGAYSGWRLTFFHGTLPITQDITP